jgi:hypothetical protein
MRARLRCLIEGAWETFTMSLFWQSLVRPPLVVVDGHIWPYPPEWSEPQPSRYPDDWPGLVEVDVSRCVRCGYQPSEMWRRFG